MITTVVLLQQQGIGQSEGAVASSPYFSTPEYVTLPGQAESTAAFRLYSVLAAIMDNGNCSTEPLHRHAFSRCS